MRTLSLTAWPQEFDGGARGNPGLAGAGAVVYDGSTGEEVKLICNAPALASYDNQMCQLFNSKPSFSAHRLSC